MWRGRGNFASTGKEVYQSWDLNIFSAFMLSSGEKRSAIIYWLFIYLNNFDTHIHIHIHQMYIFIFQISTLLVSELLFCKLYLNNYHRNKANFFINTAIKIECSERDCACSKPNKHLLKATYRGVTYSRQRPVSLHLHQMLSLTYRGVSYGHKS